MRSGKKLGLKLVSLSMLLTGTAQAERGGTYPNVEETNRIAYSLMTVLKQCPNRIWPEIKVSQGEFLLVNKELKKQILVSPRDKKISTIANEDLPSHVFQSTYSQIQHQGRTILYLDSQYGKYKYQPQSRALELAVHESFHMNDQRTWVREKVGARGTSFPMLAAPRIARLGIYSNLVAAFLDKKNSTVHLQKARYWFEQWTAADPTETQSTTDGYEGTARYVDIMAGLLGARGCGATEAELENVARENEILKAHGMFGMKQLDSEGYDVGGVSSLILRFQFPNSDWQKRVAKGETPLEILMKDIKPISNQLDRDRVEEIGETIEDKNLEVGDMLRSTLEDLQSPSSVYLAIPMETMRTSFSPMGFYISRETGDQFTPMAGALTFQFKDTASSVRSNELTVFVDLKQNGPCYGWTTLVDKSAIQANGAGRYAVKTALVEGQFAGKMQKDAQGRQWLCAEDK